MDKRPRTLLSKSKKRKRSTPKRSKPRAPLTSASARPRSHHKSVTRYLDSIESSRDLICTHDLDGQILSLNQGAVTALGFTLEEVLSLHIQDVLATEVAGEFETYMRTIQRNGKATGRMMIRTRSGEKRVWEYHNRLLRQRGRKAVITGLAHDVTDFVRAEESLKRQSRRLQVLSQAIQRINTVLEIPVVLRSLMEAAVELVDGSCAVAGLITQG